jgi:hypothetical protein
MTSQNIPRGHHPGPRRGEGLGTKPKLSARFSVQCQDKTEGETKVLTSMLVKEGSLGPRALGPSELACLKAASIAVRPCWLSWCWMRATAPIIGSYVVTQF